MNCWKLTVSAVLMAALAYSAGCGGPGGPQPVPVAGTVLIDGKPLANASIQVLAKDARAATGQSDEQGRFKLTTYKDGDGCVPGTHPVVVVAVTAKPGEMLIHTPEKYMEPLSTDLQLTVEKSTDSAKLELTWGGQKGPIIKKMDRE